MTGWFHQRLAENAYDGDIAQADTRDLMLALLINATGDEDPQVWEEFEGVTRVTRGYLEVLAAEVGVTEWPEDNVPALTRALLDEAGVPYDDDKVAHGNHVSRDTLRALLLALVLEDKREDYIPEETRYTWELIERYAPTGEAP